MAGLTVGYMACPMCGKDGVAVKVNQKGHLYHYCPAPADGGCACGNQSRSSSGDERIAAKINKWAKPEYRQKLKVALVVPEPEIAVAPKIDDEEAPLPVKPAASGGSWFDKPLF